MRFDVWIYLSAWFEARCDRGVQNRDVKNMCKSTRSSILQTVRGLFKILSYWHTPLQQKKDFLKIFEVRRWKNEFS